MKRIFIMGMVGFLMGLFLLTDGDAREKTQIRVQVLVQADTGIQSSIENQLRQGLRGLEDVVLVSEKPDFEIRVIAMESMTTEKEKTGIALATVFLRPYIRSGIPEIISSRCKEDPTPGRTTGTLQNSQIYKDHLLQIGTSDDIEQICKDIVFNFKANILEADSVLPRKPK